MIELAVGIHLPSLDPQRAVERGLLIPELTELRAVLMACAGNAVQAVDPLDIADQLVRSIAPLRILKVGENRPSFNSQQRLAIKR